MQQKTREIKFYDSAHKENILGRKQTRLELWEEHLKDPIIALDIALKCVENSIKADCLLKAFVKMTCGREGSGMVPELWGKLLWEKVWPQIGPAG